MSTLYEVFGDEPICKHAGTQFDPAGGYDVVCLKHKVGTFYCHGKCPGYEPDTKENK